MKKILALLLVVLMVFSLVACGGGNKDADAPDSGADSAGTPSGDDKDAGSGDAAAGGAVSGTVGYITDEVDHHARDTYNFVYMYNSPSNLTNYMFECMTNLSERLNYKITEMTANGDANLYINNIETVLLNEPDGLVVDVVFEYQARIVEILNEAGIPYISLFNSVLDENGYELVPTVMMNQYLNGQKQAEHLCTVYKDYWGDIDTSKLGQIILTWSLNADLQTREKGAHDKFSEYFPNNEVHIADAVTAGSLNAQAAFDLVSGIISANPHIEYWFINSVVEDMSIGAARATESLGREGSVLITGSGSSVLPDEWDAGYKGNWIANFAVSNYEYAVPAVCGLIAMADGRATMTTLWEDLKRDGDIAAQFVVGENMITYDNYKEFFTNIEKGFGIES